MDAGEQDSLSTPPDRVIIRVDAPDANMKPRRVGVFQVSFPFLDLDDEAVRALMREIVVLDARADLGQGLVQYTALCQHFDLIECGAIVPAYDVRITKMEGLEPLLLEWKRRL
jgi:hypothetical protein